MSEQRSKPRDAAEQEAAAQPRRRLPLAGALRGMEEQLRRHSALEDLGPLFGAEAQGRQPNSSSSAQPAPPSGQT